MAFTCSPRLIHWRKQSIHQSPATKLIRQAKALRMQSSHSALLGYSAITLNSFRQRRPSPSVDPSGGTLRTYSIPSPAHPTSLTSNYPPILKLLLYSNPLPSPMRRSTLLSQPGLVLPRHSGNVWDGVCAPCGGKSQIS
jgi:hypothetical protein